MATFVKSYGDYMIYNTIMNQYVVKDKDNRVVFTTLGLDSALEWCKKH